MVNRLINIISREAEIFETFLSLLQRQKDVLISDDLEGLREVTRRQQETAIESRRLAKEREQVIEELRAEFAVSGDLTLSRLLELVDDREAEQLARLKDLIFSLNEEITQTRNSNVLLLNQSRDYIARTMNMLSRMHQPSNTYPRPGREDTRGNAVAVDRRA
jgi:hypothetical protein